MRAPLRLFAPFALVIAALAACSSSSTSSSLPGSDGGTSSGGGSGGAGSSGGGGSSGGTIADAGRAVATCAVAAQVAQSGGGTLADGSWGLIPKPLHTLPPGATLCGTAYSGAVDAGNAGATYILSDLSGTALESFYAPLVAQVSGCSALTDIQGSYSYTCPCPTPPCGMNTATGLIIPAPLYQILELSYTP